MVLIHGNEKQMQLLIVVLLSHGRNSLATPLNSNVQSHKEANQNNQSLSNRPSQLLEQSPINLLPLLLPLLLLLLWLFQDNQSQTPFLA